MSEHNYLEPMLRLSSMLSKLEEYGYSYTVSLNSDTIKIYGPLEDMLSMDQGDDTFQGIQGSSTAREFSCQITVEDEEEEEHSTVKRKGGCLEEAIEKTCIEMYRIYPMAANSSPPKFV